jgi:hypothetical protein
MVEDEATFMELQLKRTREDIKEGQCGEWRKVVNS